MEGLTSAEAERRLARDGSNALAERTPDPAWRRFLRQFTSPLIYILLFAVALDLAVWLTGQEQAWPVEAITISLILLLNAGLGMYQEHRSEAALAHLKTLTGSKAWVFRDGRLAHLSAHLLVRDDVVRLEAGDRIPADGMLHEPRAALLDESVLTGESVPVDKAHGDEAFSGTLLVRGQTLLRVTRTGPSSAMGRLATTLNRIETSQTPLERQVDQLGRQVAVWVLTLAAVLWILGVVADGLSQSAQVLLFAVALAVAAVPEGLPAVLTVSLSLGVERMARHRAVVRRLSAVEALGSVTVAATDKTGTLTENRMDVHGLDAPDRPMMLRALVLANDADLTTGAGDPLELGLLRYADKEGVDPSAVRGEHPRAAERPFDSSWKFSRVTVHERGHLVSYVKGAPEVILDLCVLSADERASWHERALTLARDGFRVLAAARAEGETESGLSWLGLAAFWDAPRPEVRAAVEAAVAAGVRVLMITGDHPATALAIARQVGIAGARVMTGDDLDRLPTPLSAEAIRDVLVFARVRPEQKLQLVEALQAGGHVVAMTGDGVNDAPALKRADVGVAMGQRGSDVSREVADLVLLDDNFATIVTAVEHGRGIYHNIQKTLRFLFSTNLSEVLLIAIGTVLAFVLGMRDPAGHLILPLTAAQILWINLLTDGLPALALAFDRTPGVLTQPPRAPGAPLLDRHSLRFVLTVGSVKAALALALFALVPQLGYDMESARATVFHFMAAGQLLLVYPARRAGLPTERNAFLHAAVIGGVLLQIGIGWMPSVSRLLGTPAIPLVLWMVVAGAALLAWLLAETIARLTRDDWRRSACSLPESAARDDVP
ncbi:MAG: HAD-IC family P-type ATPase [Vicinamibacterales bacterium]